jgi:cell division protein FtsI/penicillin-binding protein 2
VVSISDEPYQQAEIASGFNRKTILSPLHAALMTAAIVNSGQMIEPTIVDRIIDSNGQTVYQTRVTPFRRVCSPEATHVLKELMHATIRSGTCKKAFRNYKRDPVLSRLYIGGKSGSISNRAHDARFDWFAGFAEEKNGPAKIAVSVVVAHEKYIGIRAGQYAHMIIKRHFGEYFAAGGKTSNQRILDS